MTTANYPQNQHHQQSNYITVPPHSFAMPKTITGRQGDGPMQQNQQQIQQQQKQQQQKQQQRRQQQQMLNTYPNYIKDGIDTITPSPPPPPLLKASQKYNRSFAALPHLGIYENYDRIPLHTSPHMPLTNQSGTCRRYKREALQSEAAQHFQSHQQYPCYNCYPIERNVPQVYTCPCSGNDGRPVYLDQHQTRGLNQVQGQQNLSSTEAAATTTPPADIHRLLGQGCYCGSDNCLMSQFEEQESGLPGLRDQEFYLLHRNIPALRRTGIDTTGIRQHFFPDGGWGWIICAMSFLIHLLTTGLQLSSSITLFYAVQHIHSATGIEWLGGLNWSISMLISPFIDTICRRKSTRLLAIVGGLIMSLGILFTSFATEVDQIVFSYGFIYGIGASIVRETSTIMLGNYFKKRRPFVEMIAMSGEGIGIALFSVLLREGVGKMGWRCGLQIIAAICSITFFVGLLYRPASLYHPQRRAIQHLKNQRKKLRDHKVSQRRLEPNIFKKTFQDISILKSSTAKILLLTSAVTSLGVYAPILTMSFNAAQEVSDVQELVLVQTILGLSVTVGVILAGALIRRPFIVHNFIISNAVISQFFIASVSLAILLMSFVMSYKGVCVLSGLYGVGFGGFRFSFKMLALEHIKVKFSRTWSFLHGIEAIPVLISVPLTVFLNDYSLKYGRAGYYICSAATAIAAIVIFFINQTNYTQRAPTAPRLSQENGLRSISTQYGRTQFPPICPGDYMPKIGACDYAGSNFLNRSCVSLNQIDSPSSCLHDSTIRNQYHQKHHLRHHHPIMPFHNSNPHMCLPATHINHESPAHYPGLQYDMNRGHCLRRSLSYLQNRQLPHCCSCSHLQCHCQGRAIPWSHRDLRMEAMPPLVYACNPALYTHNCRSQSVPEGLSSIGQQQCHCKSQPTREIIYIPRTQPQSPTLQNLASAKHFPVEMPKCRLKRSQSCTRPLQFVEQITTSV